MDGRPKAEKDEEDDDVGVERERDCPGDDKVCENDDDDDEDAANEEEEGRIPCAAACENQDDVDDEEEVEEDEGTEDDDDDGGADDHIDAEKKPDDDARLAALLGLVLWLFLFLGGRECPSSCRRGCRRLVPRPHWPCR